mmetsp:Transcript_24946/g.68432  ORF Transcript_24946/g.68432 Transcript_24946/m.68432 type:complete len:1333 (+) Transcript_24946:959-4957(+)
MSAPRYKWMERFSVADRAESLGNGTWFETSSSSTYVRNDNVGVSQCTADVLETLRSSRRLPPGMTCVVVTGSSQDGVYVQDGECNGKPTYTRALVQEGRAPLPASLYSPSRRNSWLIGTEPCRANGWVEVRSAAERAEYIQAGASGPWQEYNGSSWARSAAIRALTHCGSAAGGCAYLSGSRHQQHTHGLYTPTTLTCSGKPVYIQQIGGDTVDNASAEQALYLYAPAGRESWMVGREACKPSGWLEVHSSAPFVEAIHGEWREHVPGGNWHINPSIRLQLHPLQDAFSGFSFADGRASLRDPNLVLWRLTALLSSNLAPPTDAERSLIDRAVAHDVPHAARRRGLTWAAPAARLRRLKGRAGLTSNLNGTTAGGSGSASAGSKAQTEAEMGRRLEVGRRLREDAAAAVGREVAGPFFEDSAACVDLAVEPSLEGGRLLIIEQSPTPARVRVAARLPGLGWTFAWTSSSHYSSAGVREWLQAVESVSTRRHTMRPRAPDGSSVDDVSCPGCDGSNEQAGNANLGLLSWRKVPFLASDLVELQEACAAEGLVLESLTLLAADRVQGISIASLNLSLARIAYQLNKANGHVVAIGAILLAVVAFTLCARRVGATGRSLTYEVSDPLARGVALFSPPLRSRHRMGGDPPENPPRKSSSRNAGGSKHTIDGVERRVRRGPGADAPHAAASRLGVHGGVGQQQKGAIFKSTTGAPPPPAPRGPVMGVVDTEQDNASSNSRDMPSLQEASQDLPSQGESLPPRDETPSLSLEDPMGEAPLPRATAETEDSSQCDLQGTHSASEGSLAARLTETNIAPSTTIAELAGSNSEATPSSSEHAVTSNGSSQHAPRSMESRESDSSVHCNTEEERERLATQPLSMTAHGVLSSQTLAAAAAAASTTSQHVKTRRGKRGGRQNSSHQAPDSTLEARTSTPEYQDTHPAGGEQFSRPSYADYITRGHIGRDVQGLRSVMPTIEIPEISRSSSSSNDSPEWARGSPCAPGVGVGLDDWARSTQAVGAMLIHETESILVPADERSVARDDKAITGARELAPASLPTGESHALPLLSHSSMSMDQAHLSRGERLGCNDNHVRPLLASVDDASTWPSANAADLITRARERIVSRGGFAPSLSPQHVGESLPATPCIAPASGRQFSLSDASLAEMAALSVLDDFPFDIPGNHAREEAVYASQRSFNSTIGFTRVSTNPSFGAGPFGSFGGPFAPASATGVPLPSVASTTLTARLEGLNATAPLFDPASQAAVHAQAAAQVAQEQAAQAHAAAQAACAQLMPHSAQSGSSSGSVGGNRRLGAVDVDQVVAGLSKEEMMRMMSEMQKRLEQE